MKKEQHKNYKLSDYHLDIFYLVKLINLSSRANYTQKPLKKHINTENLHWYALSRFGWVDGIQRNNDVLLTITDKGQQLIKHFVPKSLFLLRESVFNAMIFGVIIAALSIALLPNMFWLLPVILMIAYIYLLFFCYVHHLPAIADKMRLDKYLKIFNSQLVKINTNKRIIDDYKPFFVKYSR